MGDIQFNGTPEEWDALVKKNKKKEEPKQDLPGINGETFKVVLDRKYFTKQETLEEAAEKFADDCTLVSDAAAYKGFIDGAKWQQERMYSEEEVSEIAKDAYTMGRNNILIGVFNKWFEQFKKKEL